MKKNILILSCLLCILLSTQAQNLVPNPSFEDTINCAQFNHSPNAAYPWFNPTHSTPDYFSIYPNCGSSSLVNPSGYQLPYSGNAYCGIYIYADGTLVRDYLEVKLSYPMAAERQYDISFFASLANESVYAADRIGAYLAPDSVIDFVNFDTLNVSPQIENPVGNILVDTTGWIKISGLYTAVGNEKYLVIGNFYDNSNTNFSLVNSSGLISTTAYYYIDSVTISEIPAGLNESYVEPLSTIFPNPSHGKFQITNNTYDLTYLIIYSSIGEKVFEGSFLKSFETSLPSGIYFLNIIGTRKNYFDKLIIY